MLETLARMAAGETQLRLPVRTEGDHLDALAYGINILAEELEYHVAQLRDDKETANRANQAKSTFVSHISHEIRTPLIAITGFTDLLLNRNLSEEKRADYLRRVQSNCSQLRKLIDEVLDLSKVEAGELALEEISIPLREKIAEIAGSLDAIAKKKGLSLSVRMDASVPERAITDPLRLWQILNNLVGNAIKFSNAGTIQIHIQYNGQGLLSLDVLDNGIGIGEEYKAHLFAPFTQADGSITRCFGGTGLGLTLSRLLCRAMGGELELVASTLGKGSHFRASVLIRRCEESSEEPSRPSVLDETCWNPLRGKNILIAEDTEDTGAFLAEILADAGATTHVFRDGYEIVRGMKGDSDLILMDIQMPRMDGFEATRSLRARGYKLPIIALTAHAMLGERERCLAQGFTDYVTKPIQRREFLARLAEHLRH